MYPSPDRTEFLIHIHMFFNIPSGKWNGLFEVNLEWPVASLSEQKNSEEDLQIFFIPFAISLSL